MNAKNGTIIKVQNIEYNQKCKNIKIYIQIYERYANIQIYVMKF